MPPTWHAWPPSWPSEYDLSGREMATQIEAHLRKGPGEEEVKTACGRAVAVVKFLNPRRFRC